MSAPAKAEPHHVKSPGSKPADARDGLRIARENDVVVLTLDRPHVRNAIHAALAKAIGDATRAASEDRAARAVILTGEGPVFSAGGDLEEISALAASEPGVDGARRVTAMFDDHLSAIEASCVPVIAAVQGDAFGGAVELLLLCDIVVMDERAHLGLRHAKMGLSPAWGGFTRLIARVGPMHAGALLFTAQTIPAHTALALGLAHRVAEPGASLAIARTLAHQIAQNPRDAVADMKRALRAIRAAGDGDGPDIERLAFESRWGSPDHQTAMLRFRSQKKS